MACGPPLTWPPGRLFGRACPVLVTTWREAARAGVEAAWAAAQGAAGVKEAVVERSHELGDIAAKAAAAPGDVAAEVRREVDLWWAGVSRSLVLGGSVAALALFGLVITSLAVVVALNRALGDPNGTLVVGAVFLLALLLPLARLRQTASSPKA